MQCKNDLVLLLESSSPLDYSILTPLVSFILLCEFVEADLTLSLGTLTLTDIDHVSIMKEVESPAKLTQNMLAYMGIELCLIPILAVLVRRLGDIRSPYPACWIV